MKQLKKLIFSTAFLLVCAFTIEARQLSNEEQSSKDARSGFRDTVWPTVVADLWRSNSVVGAGLPTQLKSSSLVTRSVTLPPYPMFGITYDKNNLFVIGGAPFMIRFFTDQYKGSNKSGTWQDVVNDSRLDRNVNPYIAKVNSALMSVEVLDLPKGTTANYIGGVIAHENGMLYVVATSTLFEIDPKTLKITRKLSLPVPKLGGQMVIYNSIVVWPETGDLILKRFNKFNSNHDALVLVETGSRKLRVSALTSTPLGWSRVTVATDPTPYLYVLGLTQTMRFKVSQTGFACDKKWSQTYRAEDDGTQQGGALVYMGSFKSVMFLNNGAGLLGVAKPLKIYGQSTETINPTLEGARLASSEPGGLWATNSADPHKTGITVGIDYINRVSAAWAYSGAGKLFKIWENASNTPAIGTAIAVDQGHVYTDDRKCDDNGESCTLFFVVLDLRTGLEIARTEVAGTLPSLGHMFVNENDAFYIATEAGEPQGYLTRITAL